jgi:hypothetical protein
MVDMMPDYACKDKGIRFLAIRRVTEKIFILYFTTKEHGSRHSISQASFW